MGEKPKGDRELRRDAARVHVDQNLEETREFGRRIGNDDELIKQLHHSIRYQYHPILSMYCIGFQHKIMTHDTVLFR